jgi:trigger factor
MANEFELKETKLSELKIEWEIGVPAKAIVDSLEDRLKEEQKTFQMAGYRVGNVPMQMVRKNKGPELLSRIIEQKVDEILKQLFTEKDIRPAMQPMVEVMDFDDKTTLKFKAIIELLPPVPEVDWTQFEVDSYNVIIGDEDIQNAYKEIINRFKTFEDAPTGYAAKKGDAVIIDFHGTINGEDFDGNKGEGVRLELGSNQFIPGFEDQLIGAKAGAQIKVRVMFPKNYSNNKVAGKPAVFDVKVIQVLKPEDVDSINDDFAKKLGLETVEKLEELVREKISADFNGLARMKLKKDLFDQIHAKYKFDVPAGMIKLDLDAMMQELKNQKAQNPQLFKGKTEADMRTEYEQIAVRRVLLGILLANFARDNNIEITDADLQQAIFSEAMSKPGQERLIMDYYSKPENMERLKGPILEEKAVDMILNQVKINIIEVSSKEFMDKYANDLGQLEQQAAN